MKHYLLLGYHGCGNLGDDALLFSFLSKMKTEDRQFHVLKRRKGNRWFLWLRILHEIRKTDGLILSGGNLLQNRTSHLSLLFYGTCMLFGEKCKKSVTLFGGIGEIDGKRLEKFTALCLSRTSALYLRSHKDIETARALCQNADLPCPPTFFYPDTVFSLPGAEKRKKAFGVFLFKKAKKPDRHLRILNTLRKLALPFLLVTMSAEDRRYLKKLGQMTGLPVMVPTNDAELFTILRDAAFSISERYHGAVFSLLSETPCFFELSSVKNQGLYEDILKIAKEAGGKCPLFGFVEYPFPKGGHDTTAVSFLRKKIGGISASDFEKVRCQLQAVGEGIIDFP